MQGLVGYCKDIGWLLLSVKWGSLCRIWGRGVTGSDLHVKIIPVAVVVRKVKGEKDGHPR